MKILLTGATGFVGGEVLAQLLVRPKITRVTCVTRKPLQLRHEKLATVLQSDFTCYDEATLEQFADHAACIWTLGGKASDFPTPEGYLAVTHTFTLALATALAGRGPFTFCYLSGMGADPTESSWLPWERTTRHFKGRTERDLMALAARQRTFAARCFRPGGILPRSAGRVERRLLRPIALGVDELACALIRVAEQPRATAQDTLSNREILRLAQLGPIQRPQVTN